MEQKFLTVKQAALILGVSPLTIRNWDKKGYLIAHRNPINNYRVYPVESIEEVLKKMQRAPNQPKKLRVNFIENDEPDQD